MADLLTSERKSPGITLDNQSNWITMFDAALFTIAKMWKPPKCPPRDEEKENLLDPYDGVPFGL